jgi:hypothetical protein
LADRKEDKTAGLRSLARDGAAKYLTEEQLDALFEGALAITKKAWGTCPGCKKQVQVDITDAKAVIGALSDLVTKIADVPKEEDTGEKITFERVIYMESPDEARRSVDMEARWEAGRAAPSARSSSTKCSTIRD